MRKCLIPLQPIDFINVSTSPLKSISKLVTYQYVYLVYTQFHSTSEHMLHIIPIEQRYAERRYNYSSVKLI